MTFELDLSDHEHAFFYDEDPRFLICRCGQYARRSRTDHGQPIIVLIDPPQPIFVLPEQADDPRVEQADAREPARDAVGA